ncbi:MAG: hypothetical protein M3O23_08980 [Actinomycetota bacterium]|nr:hypothetical protein [Actinomycetota bacterium]
MESLAYLLAPLGCAVAMVVLMGMMLRGQRRPHLDPPEDTQVAGLRAEVAELRATRPGAGDA